MNSHSTCPALLAEFASGFFPGRKAKPPGPPFTLKTDAHAVGFMGCSIPVVVPTPRRVPSWSLGHQRVRQPRAASSQGQDQGDTGVPRSRGDPCLPLTSHRLAPGTGAKKKPPSSKQESGPQHPAPLGEGCSPGHCSPQVPLLSRTPGSTQHPISTCPPQGGSHPACLPQVRAAAPKPPAWEQVRAPWKCGSSSEAKGGPAAPGARAQPQRAPRGATVTVPGVPGGRRPGGTHLPRAQGRLPDAFTPPAPDSGARHVGFPQAQVSPTASTVPRGRGDSPMPCRGDRGFRATAARFGVSGLLPSQSGHLQDHLVLIPAAVETWIFLNDCNKDEKKPKQNIIWLQADHKTSLLKGSLSFLKGIKSN